MAPTSDSSDLTSSPLSDEFIGQFVEGVSDYSPDIIDAMSPEEIHASAASIYQSVVNTMDRARLAEFTPEEFRSITSLIAISAELAKAGFDVAEFGNVEDYRDAIESRRFRQHLRTKLKVAKQRRKELKSETTQAKNSVGQFRKGRSRSQRTLRRTKQERSRARRLQAELEDRLSSEQAEQRRIEERLDTAKDDIRKAEERLRGTESKLQQEQHKLEIIKADLRGRMV